MSRAARNSTCCDHASADHDLFGCAVNLSAERRTYVRCHGLVEAQALGRGVDAPTSENARIVRALHSSRTELTEDEQ